MDTKGQINSRFILVFSQLESDPGFTNVEVRPILQVLIYGIRVEARGTTKHYKPEERRQVRKYW